MSGQVLPFSEMPSRNSAPAAKLVDRPQRASAAPSQAESGSEESAVFAAELPSAMEHRDAARRGAKDPTGEGADDTARTGRRGHSKAGAPTHLDRTQNDDLWGAGADIDGITGPAREVTRVEPFGVSGAANGARSASAGHRQAADRARAGLASTVERMPGGQYPLSESAYGSSQTTSPAQPSICTGEIGSTPSARTMVLPSARGTGLDRAAMTPAAGGLASAAFGHDRALRPVAAMQHEIGTAGVAPNAAAITTCSAEDRAPAPAALAAGPAGAWRFSRGAASLENRPAPETVAGVATSNLNDSAAEAPSIPRPALPGPGAEDAFIATTFGKVGLTGTNCDSGRDVVASGDSDGTATGGLAQVVFATQRGLHVEPTAWTAHLDAQRADAAARQIAAAISTDTSDGAIELRLDPPELGRVEIQFDFGEDSLRAVIAAERPATVDALRRHGDLLLQQLRAAGFANVDLGFGSFGSGLGRGRAGLSGLDRPAPTADEGGHRTPNPMNRHPLLPQAAANDQGLDLKV